jgi:N-acetylneuraminic acid mutarotase
VAAVTGQDGRIYTLGGTTEFSALGECVPVSRPSRPRECQIVRAYDPQKDAWTPLASLRVERVMPATAMGPDGRIYAIGGSNGGNAALSSAEVYNPRTNRWNPIAGMIHDRTGFAAATAPDGRIYVIGGCLITDRHRGGFGTQCNSPSPIDAYDPRTNTWTTIGSTLNVRQGLAATTGRDGRIYAVGGLGDGKGKLLEVLPSR